MAVRMTILSGSLKGQAFLLEASKIKIGRGPGVDFELKEPSISKVHAQIEILDNQIRVQDLNSRNGLRVGGKAVSKIRMKQGIVHIGKIPIKLEFETATPVAPPVETESVKAELETKTDMPKVEEIHWQDDDNADDDSQGFTTPADKVKKPSATASIIAYVFLGLCLVGIILFSLKDVLNPPIERLEAEYQFTFNIASKRNPYPFEIVLPAPYSGPRTTEYFEKHFSRPSFNCRMAEGSGTVFLVYPEDETESATGEELQVPLRNGQILYLTLKIHVDTTPIPVKKVVEISEGSAIIMYQEVKKHGDRFEKIPFNTQIQMWKSLKEIIDSARTYGTNYKNLGDIRHMKKKLSRIFESIREERFNAAINEYRKFSDHRNPKYIKNAIEIIDGLMQFTDRGSSEEEAEKFARYNSFRIRLLTMYKQYNKKK